VNCHGFLFEASSAGGPAGVVRTGIASTALITRDEIDTKGDYDILSAVTRSTGFSQVCVSCH
jgi:hypothetical protein